MKAAQKEIKTLRQEAAACDAADAAVKSAMREAQRYLGAAPPFLAQAKDAGVAQLADLRRLWLEWSTGRDIDDPVGARGPHGDSRPRDERGDQERRRERGARARTPGGSVAPDRVRDRGVAAHRAQGARGQRHHQANQGSRGLVEGDVRRRSRRALRADRHPRPRRLEPVAAPEQRRSRRRRPRRHRRASSRRAAGDGGRHAGRSARRHEPGRASLAGA